MKKTLEMKMASADGYDLCIKCNKKTKYKTDVRIDTRDDYVEGCGQLCNGCGYEIFGGKR